MFGLCTAGLNGRLKPLWIDHKDNCHSKELCKGGKVKERKTCCLIFSSLTPLGICLHFIVLDSFLKGFKSKL